MKDFVNDEFGKLEKFGKKSHDRYDRNVILSLHGFPSKKRGKFVTLCAASLNFYIQLFFDSLLVAGPVFTYNLLFFG